MPCPSLAKGGCEEEGQEEAAANTAEKGAAAADDERLCAGPYHRARLYGTGKIKCDGIQTVTNATGTKLSCTRTKFF
jgi:hypothetical protein